MNQGSIKRPLFDSLSIRAEAPGKKITINRRWVQIVIHLAAWVCFLMLPLFFFPRPLDASFIPEQAFTLFFFLSNFFYIAFYYSNSNLLIPKLLEQKKIVAYTFIIIGLMIFFGVFPRLYQHYFGDIQRFSTSLHLPARTRNLRPPILSGGSIAIFLLVFMFSTGIKVINQWLQAERRSKQIENEKLSTELSFLKAQINPHFLFNTLNNIYSLAADKSDLTAPAVMKLSSIMRYVLSEAKHDAVPLEKEIKFIADYIELQKMRTTSKTSVCFTVEGDASGKQISPLLFLPFVENAFKYGVSTRELSPIHILLEMNENEVHFKIKNNKHPHSSLKPSENTGIGIQNSRRRLELLYQDRYTFEMADDPSTYTVNLNIQV
jgi:two-component system, LytTR family, sensor kinase